MTWSRFQVMLCLSVDQQDVQDDEWLGRHGSSGSPDVQADGT